MTELLERAITAVKKLPPDTQDAIAAYLLNEIDDEQAWSASFAATTDTQWDCLADKVRKSITTGRALSLDDVFPPNPALVWLKRLEAPHNYANQSHVGYECL